MDPKRGVQSQFGESFRLPLDYNSGQLSGRGFLTGLLSERGFGGIFGIWGMGNCSGQWSVVSGQWSVVGGRWPVGGGTGRLRGRA